MVCFVAQDQFPYHRRESLNLKYDICIDENIKEVHTKAISNFYPKPTASPDENMILYPFWSTWAQYKTNVNQTIVLDYARRIVSEGFQNNSHIEIDDHWESCYGERQFDTTKFPDPKGIHQIPCPGNRNLFYNLQFFQKWFKSWIPWISKSPSGLILLSIMVTFKSFVSLLGVDRERDWFVLKTTLKVINFLKSDNYTSLFLFRLKYIVISKHLHGKC